MDDQSRVDLHGHAVSFVQTLISECSAAAKHRPLPVVDLPAVGVWGSRDHMMPHDGMAIYLPLVPRVALSVIPDAGHLITEETPQEVNTALLEMLSRS